MHRSWVDKHVEFLGFAEADEDVIRNIKSASVFVLLLIREGFPNTILEANVCSVPSIVVDDKENDSTAVVKDGVTGFITEVSAETIATRLVDCLTDDYLHDRLSVGVRQLGKDHDWNVIVEQLEEIYSNVT